MAEPFVQFAFSAGVLSDAFLARPDLEKFDLGLRAAENWLIDYRGGATVRPGFEFINYAYEDDKPIRLQPFEFNTALANTYMVVFAHERISFVQGGQYVLEDSFEATSLQTDGTLTTALTHDIQPGDLAYLDMGPGANRFNRTCLVGAVTDTTLILQEIDGTVFSPFQSTENFSAATVAKVYSIASPYQSEDLFDLVFDQFRDEINITSTKYAPRKLRRAADTNWTLAETEFQGNDDSPSSITVTASGTGGSALGYAVTAISADGQESFFETATLRTGIVNFSTTAGSAKITWPAVSGVNKYRVYRTIFTDSADITFTQPFGLLGDAFGPQFIDNNITPDFTRIPPFPDNPFADGAVLSVTITDGGSGYTKNGATVSITGGSNFVGLPVVNESGEIIAVRVLNGGEGYTGETLTFGGAGTGATATFTTSPATGNWPQCSARVQQRRIYGGTINLPMNIFGSVPGAEESFSFTLVGSASDAFDLSLDSEQLTPIKFITPASIGFFAFTESTVFQIRGTDDSIITGSTAIAEPKTAKGCGNVPPLKISEAVVFLVAGSVGVNSLRPSNLPNYFQLEDNSIYSSQYFTPENPVQSWTYADVPDKVVWAQRQDGTLLSMTFVPDQNVYAWTDHSTDGYIESVASVRENNFDRVYLVVRRKRAGTWHRYIERLTLTAVKNDEDMDALDCVKHCNLTSYPGTVTPSAATGNGVTFTTSEAVVVSSNVGEHVRCGNGRALITAVNSSTEFEADIELPITDLAPQTGAVKTYSDWTVEERKSVVKNLAHLEGREVQVLADGGTEAPKTVVDGEITLGQPASYVAVGLSYSGDLITLPLKSEAGIVFDKKKRPINVSLRVLNSRGLEASAFGSNRFYEFKERTFEDYGVPTQRQSGIREIAVVADWTEDAGFIIRKSKPLRATVLGFVLNSEVGLD